MSDTALSPIVRPAGAGHGRLVRRTTRRLVGALAGVVLAVVLSPAAAALDIQVVGPAGETVAGFRWLVQEDTTYGVVPGVSCLGPVLDDCPSVNFHKSHARVIAAGDSANPSIVLPSDRRYFVSVLPHEGYANGGAPVAAGQTTVSVLVQPLPLPTAQIRVLVFEDNFPINGAPDTPEEVGLEGFDVLLFDAGGRYGMAGGQVTQDAFGNPLATTYDALGNVLMMGNGILRTGADGVAVIKNLAPGKYGVQVVPPPGQGWQQTSTIEGTRTIDAWVKAGEPSFFTEFGPPGPHVFIGFIRPFKDTAVLRGGATLRGQIRSIHNSRPPDFTFYTGWPFPVCWVGLNALAGGVGQALTAAPCNPDSTFEITGVPPGSYGLAIWDANLDAIIASLGVTVPPGTTDMNLMDVPVFSWFSRIESWVFNDRDQDGFRDCVTPMCDDMMLDDVGLPEVPVNLRFRDGTIYQSYPTDMMGFVPFDEVFPFFHWLVAEVDFTRLKATGATIIVDAGGPVDPDQGWSYPSRDMLTPQPQCTSVDADGACLGPILNPNTGNNLSRTEQGPVLLEAFQGFMGQTSVIEWGKAAYGPGENGGISGIVQYATTRAEDDPRYAAAEVWEPGIPGVQVNLYLDRNRDRIIDDLDGSGGPTPADVDNVPFGWRDATAPKGAEDLDHDGDTLFDAGDAVQIVTTDSWDDAVPAGCQGEVYVLNGTAIDCFDGLRNFNQVRPGVFDGGFAFASYHPGGIASGSAEVEGLPSGTYIVEAPAPPGYEPLAEEDKNVDFGIEFTPDPLLLPPECVGDGHLVPMQYSLFPLEDGGVNVPPFRAGTVTPLCDRKQVALKQGLNAGVNFFMLTQVPIAAHVKGFILDDNSNEFDPTAPNFGEKYSPPFMPVSIRDWTGREISRVYADRFGNYNALLPSTYTMNLPMPSGVSPSMLIACMNAPGTVPNPAYEPGNPNSPPYITDPYFQRQYSQFCYTFQYMPGTTTYLDTPVVPVAAFAGPSQYPLDCELPDGTPMVWSVSGAMGGPYVGGTGQPITIAAAGMVEVPNPAFDPATGEPRTITRDYGFGVTPGTVTVGGMPLGNVVWTDGAITGNVSLPNGSEGQLVVTRADTGRSTVTGITVTVGPIAGTIRHVQPGPLGSIFGWPRTPIQDAIDAASAGDLILVAPGVYEELVIMWKPVQLQGWGAGSTIINAVKAPGEKLQAWRNDIQTLVTTGRVDLLPSQEIGFALPEPDTLLTEEGPGIIVLARAGQGSGTFGNSPNARIDGFGITGADNGGGIFVNGYASFLEISNNRVFSNFGVFGGGIRVGHPYLTVGTEYDDSSNDDVTIHHNQVVNNGGGGGAGGGISMAHGAERYRISRNFVCGNFTQGDGGGIGHLGHSQGGVIEENTIVFNHSFSQAQTVSGGGIFIGSPPALTPGALPAGSGSVKILSNVIQGNLAGAGDGGGIRTAFVSGADVAASSNQTRNWHAVDILNNIIVDNVAALAGGAISLQDTALVNILHNTIANNDSTATAGEAFAPGSPNLSTAQPAGLVARAHSAALVPAFGNRTRGQYGVFSNPYLFNNVLWHNRSFYFWIDPLADPPEYGLLPDVGAGQTAVYSDLAVLGTATPAILAPEYCILSETTNRILYSATNRYPAPTGPMFVAEYFNGDRGQTIQQPEATTTIQTAPAFDEGGNFIDVRFGPLTLDVPGTRIPYGNYHLVAGSPAVDGATNSILPTRTNDPFQELLFDIDGQIRPNPNTGVADIGADER